MARTILEIQQSIQAEAAGRPALAGLSSPSAVAIYRLWAYVTAVAMWALEMLWDQHQTEVNTTVARAKPGTAEWYANQALLFQVGDELVADDDGIHYGAGSTGARIISRAVAKENDTTGKLFVKVAKDGPTPGSLAALTGPELTQVKGYFDRKRFAGTRLEVVSRAADRLRVVAQVYYDPLLDLATMQARIKAALTAYLASLAFDGLVYLSKVEDALQAVPGVKDVKLEQVSARSGADFPVVISRVYETQAGYIVEDDLLGFGFLDTIELLPNALA